ncbi:Chromosome partition protein Smc [Bacillus sp. THAF10]|uniref:hypothetical protein n=1 Tax=Bacillus sp. THAF10 TaxID=2587848 RepID=UPI001267F588|nr:hypothetical protein [Bacillus sp. THAF10]QFT88428.1 Chromosome partition protein Smc [Bacillus sp. THAF10]
MKSSDKDNKVILQQKIIHLGAEVRRLTSDIKRLKSKEFFKKVESERSEYKSTIRFLEEQCQILKEKNSAMLHEANQIKKELSKWKEDNQTKLLTISGEFSALKQQCEKERDAHLKAIDEKERLQSEMEELQRELAKQTEINEDLEKEYDMVKETVKVLIEKIERSNRDQSGYQIVAEINEKLEKENMHFQKELEELQTEYKSLKDENSLLVEDIEKLNMCVGDLEQKNDTLVHDSTSVLGLTEKKQNTFTESKRMQSWFYNNLKKNN